MKTIFRLKALLLIFPLIISCSNDDDNNTLPEPVNEEEVITTLITTFVPQGGGTTVELITQDLDGDGPNAPVVSISGPFESDKIYDGTVQFLNELESPAEDITLEVEEEGLEHQIFYTVSNNLGVFAYADQDEDGNPIGIEFTFQTAITATPIDGLMTVTLVHEPNKDATGVSDGDIANAGGSTDFEGVYNPVTVE